MHARVWAAWSDPVSARGRQRAFGPRFQARRRNCLGRRHLPAGSLASFAQLASSSASARWMQSGQMKVSGVDPATPPGFNTARPRPQKRQTISANFFLVCFASSPSSLRRTPGVVATRVGGNRPVLMETMSCTHRSRIACPASPLRKRSRRGAPKPQNEQITTELYALQAAAGAAEQLAVKILRRVGNGANGA